MSVVTIGAAFSGADRTEQIPLIDRLAPEPDLASVMPVLLLLEAVEVAPFLGKLNMGHSVHAAAYFLLTQLE